MLYVKNDTGSHRKDTEKSMRESNALRKHFGLERIEKKVRNCLNCDKKFQSHGRNNRMCDRCQQRGY